MIILHVEVSKLNVMILLWILWFRPVMWHVDQTSSGWKSLSTCSILFTWKSMALFEVEGTLFSPLLCPEVLQPTAKDHNWCSRGPLMAEIRPPHTAGIFSLTWDVNLIPISINAALMGNCTIKPVFPQKGQYVPLLSNCIWAWCQRERDLAALVSAWMHLIKF